MRCRAYAACSELLASPHEVDPRPALRARAGLGAGWSQARHLDTLLTTLCSVELVPLRIEYSGLFEVGDEGPPVPIREQLSPGTTAGNREEVVRFYEHFGYRLGEAFAWQPDHASVELEFVHYLCFREAEAATAAEALPFQLAQADFVERHLTPWLPGLGARAQQSRPGALYARVAAGVADFVVDDLAWQHATLDDATPA